MAHEPTGLEPGRRRALREEVVLARSARSAVEPLGRQLLSLHKAAACLAARLNHIELRHGASGALRPEVEQLRNELAAALQTWRSGLTVDDPTGRVADAERSALSILGSLDDLLARIDRGG